MSAHEEEVRCYDTGIRLLARREHSQKEIRQKLIQRNFDTDVIAATIARLIDVDALSEERFIEAYIYSRTQKLYGPTKIQAELRSRGIGTDLIRSHLRKPPSFWTDLARKWVTRQRPPSEQSKSFDAQSFESSRKLYQQLRRRGFETDTIRAVIGNIPL